MFVRNRKQLAVLIDPDTLGNDGTACLLQLMEHHQPDFVFVGGSILTTSVDRTIEEIRRHTHVPIILFPGSATQFSDKADALLYLSLISGRNADYLIGQHVQSAPLLYQSGLQVIPTGYMLVESGKTTSVEYISNTRPLPRDKVSIAVATALAGQYLGMNALYLEGGSGAEKRVPDALISAVRAVLHIPLIVGGGIRSAQDLEAVYRAGADVAVIGNALEQRPELLQELR